MNDSIEDRRLRLFIAGEVSPDPNEWSGPHVFVLAETKEQALKMVDSFTITEIPLMGAPRIRVMSSGVHSGMIRSPLDMSSDRLCGDWILSSSCCTQSGSPFRRSSCVQISCRKVINQEIELKNPDAERLQGRLPATDRPVVPYRLVILPLKGHCFNRIRGCFGPFGFSSMWTPISLNSVG